MLEQEACWVHVAEGGDEELAVGQAGSDEGRKNRGKKQKNDSLMQRRGRYLAALSFQTEIIQRKDV